MKTKALLCTLQIGDEHRRIALPSFGSDHRQIRFGDPFDLRQNLPDRIAGAAVKIAHINRISVHEALQREYMAVSEVADVNVISDRSAIGRWIIDTEHTEIVEVPLDSHHRPRDQMGLLHSQLTDLRIRVSTTGIKIAERTPAKAIRARIIGQNSLDHKL